MIIIGLVQCSFFYQSYICKFVNTRRMIDDRRQTMHDDGRRPIAKVHLSDSGDLENITGKQSLANACLTPSNLCYTNLSNILAEFIAAILKVYFLFSFLCIRNYKLIFLIFFFNLNLPCKHPVDTLQYFFVQLQIN